MNEPPICLEEDQYIRREVVVNLESSNCADFSYGLDSRNSAMISRRCNLYERDVYIENPLKPLRANGKRIMHILTLEAGPGTPLKIEIEGKDEEAEKLADDLCKGLAMRSSDFHSFIKDAVQDAIVSSR